MATPTVPLAVGLNIAPPPWAAPPVAGSGGEEAAVEVRYVGEPSLDEEARRLGATAPTAAQECDRPVGVQLSESSCELRQWDVDRAGNRPGGELVSLAHVDDLHAFGDEPSGVAGGK